MPSLMVGLLILPRGQPVRVVNASDCHAVRQHGRKQIRDIGKRLMVNKKVLGFSIAATLILATLALAFNGRTQSRSPRTSPPADALSYLPASDAVMLIDLRRLLNETMPQILGGDKEKLAQANAEIDKFKSRTGIDPRAFGRVVLSVRYTYPAAKTTKLETVAIAHGTFDAKALAAAGRTAANGKYREEKYRGATIMIISINDQMKVLGLWNMRVNELAICALDVKTLAIGNLSTVRAAIDAGKRGRANGELIALASRDPKAVIGFGANLPRELMANLNVGNDTIAKDANSIRQAYGSIGTTDTDLSLSLVARTDNAEAAKNLSDTITGLKQLGAILIVRMAPARKALAQSALDNLKITTRGNELEIKTQVAAANLASVIK